MARDVKLIYVLRENGNGGNVRKHENWERCHRHFMFLSGPQIKKSRGDVMHYSICYTVSLQKEMSQLDRL